MRLLIFGDIHLADRPPSIRRDSYAEDILAKIRWAVRWAADNGCEGIVSAGDVFHVKTPGRTSHRLVQATADALTSSNLPVVVVPGNHDMQHDRLESLPAQPLGSLCKMAGVDLLLGEHPTWPIFGLPFLQDFGRDLTEWMQRYRAWQESTEGNALMVTHAPIFPPGHEPPYEFIAAQDWALMMGFGSCYYAHIHDPHGAYEPHELAEVIMCNTGAISRGSLHEATLKRSPAVTVWDSEAHWRDPFTRIEVPHKPAAEVFRLAEKQDADERQDRLDAFLSSVETTTLSVLTMEQVLAHAESMALRAGTLAEVRAVIEEVSSR